MDKFCDLKIYFYSALFLLCAQVNLFVQLTFIKIVCICSCANQSSCFTYKYLWKNIYENFRILSLNDKQMAFFFDNS